MKNFDNGILIVAHPDDECLFASSILNSISILIICFSDIPKEEDISLKRFNSVKLYPLRDLKVISLNLKQSEKAFLPINWLNINEKFSGICGGYKKKSYDSNYKKILNKLKEIIPNNSLIISHNPWGEYGHAEHCQVFKASFQIAKETNSRFFVNSYFSNLSKVYAQRKLHLLKSINFLFETNTKLYNLLKNHYSKFGCWTWYENYKLPKNESFFEIDLEKNPSLINSRRYKIKDFSLIFIKHTNPFKYYLFSILKKFIPNNYQIFLRKLFLKKPF